MIGLTTAKAALTGVETPGGFAIPINASLRRIIDVLKQGEEVEYGFLGARFKPMQRDGAHLAHVIKGSGAERAGLCSGDVLVSIGGMKVHNFDDVFLALGLNLAGSTIEVERLRAENEAVKDGVARADIECDRLAEENDRLRAEVEALRAASWRPTHRHKKRGTTYRLRVETMDSALSPARAVANVRRSASEHAVAIVDEGTGVDASWRVANGIPLCIVFEGGAGPPVLNSSRASAPRRPLRPTVRWRPCPCCPASVPWAPVRSGFRRS